MSISRCRSSHRSPAEAQLPTRQGANLDNRVTTFPTAIELPDLLRAREIDGAIASAEIILASGLVLCLKAEHMSARHLLFNQRKILQPRSRRCALPLRETLRQPVLQTTRRMYRRTALSSVRTYICGSMPSSLSSLMCAATALRLHCQSMRHR